MSELFHGSRLKIKRANEHIDDLETRLREFAAGDAYSLRLEPHPEDRRYVLEATIAKAVDPEFALLVGDALHNLRAALDFSICDIEFAFTGQRSASFPVRDSMDELKTAVNGGLVRKIPPKIISLLLDTIQPCFGGNGQSVWCLHKLEIIDKHRLLLPHMQMNGIFNVCLEDEKGKKILLPPWIVTPSRSASREFIGRNLKIANKGHLGMAIFFEEGLPMGGESIVPTLRQFSELVRGIVAIIRREFLITRRPQ